MPHHTVRPQEKKKVNTTYVLKKLWYYLKDNKLLVFFILFFNVVSNALALLSPVIIGKAVNVMEGGIGNVDFSKLLSYVVMLLAVFVISGVLGWATQYTVIKVTQKTIYAIRCNMFSKLNSFPVSYLDKNKKGDLISRVSYDIDVLSSSLSSDVIQILTSVITVVGSFIMMFVISVKLISIFFVILPLIIIFTKKMTAYSKGLFRERQKNIGRLLAHTEEMLGGQKTVMAYGFQQQALETFMEINEDATVSNFKAHACAGIIMPFLNFINNISFLLIAVIGTMLVVKNQINIGNISSFVLYSKKFTGPINELANIISELQSAMAAGERVFTIIDDEPELEDVEGAVEITSPKGNVEFKNISFGYSSDNPVIKDFSLKVEKGQVIAIVGATGSGKTTLVNLLMRFYEPDSGKIFLDDREIRQYTRKSLRKAFGMVLQESWLFTGSVKENIAYAKEDATDEEVVQAAKAAYAHDFIERLADGYDTVISQEGTSISEGQKQLLAIARAILANSPILILDEATSSVDTRTEEKIQTAMNALMKGRTSFVIAHRLSTIKHADIIVVLDHGKIVEAGNHTQLLRDKDGYYRRLYYSQFELM